MADNYRTVWVNEWTAGVSVVNAELSECILSRMEAEQFITVSLSNSKKKEKKIDSMVVVSRIDWV